MVGGLYGGLRTQGLPRSSQILEAHYRLSQRTWDICNFAAIDTQRMRSGTAATDPVAAQGGNVLRLESAVAGPKFTALIDEAGGTPVRSDFGGSDGERVLHFTSDTLNQSTGSNLSATSIYGFLIAGWTRTSGFPRIFRSLNAAGTEQFWLDSNAAGTFDVWYNVDAVTGLVKPTTDQLFVVEIDFHAGERRVTSHYIGGSDSKTASTALGTRDLAQLRLGGFDASTSKSENLRFRGLYLSSTRPASAGVLAENLAWAKIIAGVP